MTFSPLRYWERVFLWLLESKLDSPGECLATRCLASRHADTGRYVTANGKLNGIRDIGRHKVIGVTIAELRLETSEKVLFAAIPCDYNFHAWDLSPVGI
jgi:hypothetical protein